MIFTHFASQGGIEYGQSVTFEEIALHSQCMDFKEFLQLCRFFEIPVSSKQILHVFKRCVDIRMSGVFSIAEFKHALGLIFSEVQNKKLSGLD